MQRNELVRLYLRALIAEMEQGKDYLATGRWHIDCACAACRDLAAWQALSWWQRLRAKLAY